MYTAHLAREVVHAAVSAQDTAAVIAGFDGGIDELDVIALAIQHAEEAGIGSGPGGAVEVGDRVVVAVEVDALVVRADRVERRPFHAGHVDIGAETEVAALAGGHIFEDVGQMLGRGNHPGIAGDTGTGGIALLAGNPAGCIGKGQRIDRTAPQDSIRREIQGLVDELAVGLDLHLHGRARRDGQVVPGSGHPRREEMVRADGDAGKREVQFVRFGLTVAAVEERGLAHEGHAGYLGDLVRKGDDELQDTALLDGAAMGSRPSGTEGERFIGVHALQGGGIAQVRGSAVPLLGLVAPISRVGIHAGIKDGEGFAGDRPAGEFRKLGGETLLDVEYLRFLTDNGQTVCRFPAPGKAVLGADAGRVIGNGSTDGHLRLRSRKIRPGNLVAGKDDTRNQH